MPPHPCPTENRGQSFALLKMNNEPVGKRDVANVLSKYLKSVLNDNVFSAGAKQLYIWRRSDFIPDTTYKNRKVEA